MPSESPGTMAEVTSTASGDPMTITPLNKSQRRVFDDLLGIGADRPHCPDGLAEDLSGWLAEATAEAVERWTEPTLWMSKSQIMTVLRCEGQTVAYAAQPTVSSVTHRTVSGIVAHRAIQIAHSFPDQPIADYVAEALAITCEDEAAVAQWWKSQGRGRQAEVLGHATERVAGFLDSWPALDDRWEPRFEASIQAKVGRITLGGRVDLLLGRPRAPRQTMLLCDLKTGTLGDHHHLEAGYYALVATLRYGVAPYRSTVYSLASGEWTEPADVTPARLWDTARAVAKAVNAYVDVLTEARTPELRPGFHCNWCPASATCPAAETALVQKTNEVVATPRTIAAPPPEEWPTPPPSAEEPPSEGSADSEGDFGPYTLDLPA